MNPIRKSLVNYLFHVIVASFLAGIPLQGVLAQPANEPLEKFVVTDGGVYAIAKNNSTLYFGGGFTQVGLRTGSGVPVSATTGQAESVFPSINGYVNVAVADAQGGWFVGGSFTLAGGFLRTNLVHIRSDRTVDPNWCPSAFGGSVVAMVLSGNTLYLGGTFTNVNGAARNRLATVAATDGSLGSWNPDASDRVATMILNGTNVFVGGDFTIVGGQSRSRLAALDVTSGQVTSWNPGAGDSVNAMVVSGAHLYIGGYFGTAGGQSRGRLASFDLATGLLDAWNPGLGTSAIVAPIISAMAAYQNVIFIGGQFTSAGGSNRVNIAAVDATTGAATGWDAKQVFVTSSGFPSDYIVSMSIFNNAVYIGGPLINIGGQPRGFAAALDLNTGNATAWDPNPNLQPLTLCGVGGTVYVGGLFGAVGCVARTNLAAFDLASNQVTAWNPGLMTRSGVPVNALAIASNQVFVGGFFTNIGGFTRSNLASVDLVSGAVLDWTPNPPNATVYALATWSNRLFVGGTFSSISGTLRTNFAEFDLSTATLTSWDPRIRSFVRALAVDGNTLYAGGIFSTVDGQTRRRIAAFDLATDTLTSWDPGFTSGLVDAVATAAGRVYLGGMFNTVAGFNRTNFVALDAATAQVLPLAANTDQGVYGVAATSNLVFIAGNFTTVNGQKRSCIAALDPNLNTLTSWNPGADFYLQTVRVFDDVLYPGGVALRMGGESTRSIAAFPLLLVGAPAIVSNSMQRLAHGSMQFRLTALGVPQATVQVSSNLHDWQPLQTVPLVAGNGLFTDDDATNHPSQFYRVRVP